MKSVLLSTKKINCASCFIQKVLNAPRKKHHLPTPDCWHLSNDQCESTAALLFRTSSSHVRMTLRICKKPEVLITVFIEASRISPTFSLFGPCGIGKRDGKHDIWSNGELHRYADFPLSLPYGLFVSNGFHT